ncbi:SAM-dependent methyltransferase, partial [Tychonema sp. LEGE 07199]|nr:SAM-dependent methyltransferase [Tychonema sp. LEGE 07199]
PAPPCQGGEKEVQKTVGDILADVEVGLDEVRSILSKQLILLTPTL